MNPIVYPPLPAPRSDVTIEEALAIVAQKRPSVAQTYQREEYSSANQPLLKRFQDHYKCWGYFCLHGDSREITAFKTFPDRKALTEQAAEWGLDLPKDVRKTPEADQHGNPSTIVCYDVEFEFEEFPVKMELQYRRQGAPKSNCRIVARTTYDVVCDVGNEE